MNRNMKALAGALVAVALAAGCGSSSSSGGGAGGGGGTVRTAHSSSLGATVLENAKGMTLYALSAEHGRHFICTKQSTIPGGSASCLSVWIPLTVPQGTMPTGATALGTVARPDGAGTQVTYHGRPLYTFANDAAPGDASGNGFKDVGTWQAVTVGASAAPATSGSTPYGY